MIVKNYFLATNPFFDAYIQSDALGKCIFISLVALSIFSWIILIHKVLITYQARKYSARFQEAFLLQKANPLGLDCENVIHKHGLNPFLSLYIVLKKHTL